MINCYAGEVTVSLRVLDLEVKSGVRDSDRIGWLRFTQVNEYQHRILRLRSFCGTYGKDENEEQKYAGLLRKFQTLATVHRGINETEFSPPGLMWTHLLNKFLPEWNTSKISSDQRNVEQKFFTSFFNTLSLAQRGVVLFKRSGDCESTGYLIDVEGDATPVVENPKQENLMELVERIHHKISTIFRTTQSNTFGATYFVTGTTSDDLQQVKDTHCQYHILQRTVEEPQSVDLSQHIAKDCRFLEGMKISDSSFPSPSLIEEMPSHWSLMQISLWPLDENTGKVSQVFNLRVMQLNAPQYLS